VATQVDPVSGSALNEQELWREMVRWSGGRILEERGVLLVSGPSSYLRVAIRSDPRVDAAAVLARATEFFAAESTGFIVLVRRPDDEDIERAALAAGFRAGWTERSMAIDGPPSAGATPDEVEVRVVADASAVVDYGRVVAVANDDPGERERAPLLFHDETIIAPHIAAFIAYLGAEPVACAMTLVSHRVAGVFYVATVEHARRRGLGDALTRMAARAGFEMGAEIAWLGASEMGAGLYRRIGFEDLGSTVVELESPTTTSI
jgi:ribosomal protein S18 acetylase RimI-like enzyme